MEPLHQGPPLQHDVAPTRTSKQGRTLTSKGKPVGIGGLVVAK